MSTEIPPPQDQSQINSPSVDFSSPLSEGLAPLVITPPPALGTKCTIIGTLSGSNIDPEFNWIQVTVPDPTIPPTNPPEQQNLYIWLKQQQITFG